MDLSIPSMRTLLSLVPSFIPPPLYPALRTLLIKTLRLGPLPPHVGFIMDGNRRFSRGHGVAVEEGHAAGFEALKRVLDLLLRLEIPHVTVYAFAIDNFNRSPAEVEKLMELAKVKLVELCEKGALLDRHGIRVFIIGRKDLLPPDVQAACAQVEKMTKVNTRGCLNVAFPYASQEEMTTAIRRSIDQTLDVGDPPDSITPDLISSNLYTSHSPPLSILIRTSGVHRLSDFLLWQTSGSPDDAGAALHFVPRYWPDFGLLDVLPIFLGWQAEELARRAYDSARWAFGGTGSGKQKSQ